MFLIILDPDSVFAMAVCEVFHTQAEVDAYVDTYLKGRTPHKDGGRPYMVVAATELFPGAVV
jgi:hypothetical protein